MVKYVFKNGRDYTDKKLFLTKEEAEIRCKELNNPEDNACVGNIQDTSGNIEPYYEVDD